MKKSFGLLQTCTFILPFISAPAYPGMMQSLTQNAPLVASLSIAPAWHTGGRSQTKTLQEDITKHYADTSSQNTIAQGEFFLGREYVLNNTFRAQLGGAVELTSNARLRGDIWEDADPDFNNYYYQYNVNHAHIALKGKLLADVPSKWNVTPYIGASAGVGFNRASDYLITPKIFQEIPSPPFAPKTKTSFTYTLEAGMQKTLTAHTSAGIGYVFSDWGQTSLSRAPNQTLGTGLQTNHLYTNGLQLSLNYHA